MARWVRRKLDALIDERIDAKFSGIKIKIDTSSWDSIKISDEIAAKLKASDTALRAKDFS